MAGAPAVVGRAPVAGVLGGTHVVSGAGACAHCGLPLGRRPVAHTIDGVREAFCCYGCVLALQITQSRGAEGHAAWIVVRLGLAVFFTMNVMMVSVPTYVPYVYGTAAAPTDGPLFDVLRLLALVLAMPVLLLLGLPLLAGAWTSLRAGTLNADVLVVLGTFAAYGVSVANIIAGRPEMYVDTAAMLLVLVTLGRYLEASAKAEAGAAVQAGLAPLPASVRRLDGERWTATAPASLVVGDVVEVGPGGAFPTDGVVVRGVGEVDEAALTGESRGVPKSPGAMVAGGTCSIDGSFRVRVTTRAADSAAARIERLLDAARHERAAIERLADRVAGVLTPAVVAIAIGAGLWWGRVDGPGRGLLVGLSVLVVACPCAFGVATPVAIWTGFVAAVRRGVILRSASAMERAARVGRVLFDKTGTLTMREPHVVAIEPAPGSPHSADDVLAMAAAVEQGQPQPMARAVASTWQGPARTARDVRLVPGAGVRGVVDGASVAVGSRRFASASATGDAGGDDAFPVRDGESASAALYVVIDGRIAGRILLAEQVRPRAAAALEALRALGIRVGLLTGDERTPSVVRRLFRGDEIACGLRPAEKLARIEAERQQASSGGVAMVGDGLNDAPALAAADLGIAVADATDVTRLAADVAILRDDPAAVPWLLTYARRVMRVARQNLAWAFAYNAVALGVAAAGALNPLVAAVIMLVSSLVVVANARRLRAA